MSEEQQDILSMSDDDIGYLSQDEAKAKIDAVMRAGPAHPYFSNSDMKAHRVAIEKMTKLYEVTSPDEPQTDRDGQILVQQWPAHMVKIMEQGVQEQETKRQKVLDQARLDMDYLVDEHNFARAEIPDDLQPFEAALLHCERLNQEEPTAATLQELSSILEREVQNVPYDPELREAIGKLSAARLALNKFGPEQFSAIAEKIIHDINAAHDKRDAKRKRRKK